MKSRKIFLGDSFWACSGILFLFILINVNTAFAFGRPSATVVSGNNESNLTLNSTEISVGDNHFARTGSGISLENKDTVLLISKNEVKKSRENKIGAPGGIFNTTPDTEKSLPIESWMINNRYFDTWRITDADKVLKIEAWMTDKHLWGR